MPFLITSRASQTTILFGTKSLDITGQRPEWINWLFFGFLNFSYMCLNAILTPLQTHSKAVVTQKATRLTDKVIGKKLVV